jgi:hypothetical protein
MATKKRRCLKAVIYLYIPDKEDLEDKGRMKYFLGRHLGRIQLYDDKENNHIEWSIRIPWNKKDKVYQRWKKYKDNDIDVAKLNSK